MSLANDRTMVNIGRLGAAVGLKGEVRVLLYADDSENLYEGAVLLIDADRFSAGADDNSVYGVRHSAEIEVEAVRYQKGKPVVKFSGVPDRTAAEKLTGAELYIPESELAELEDGHYYYRDLIGLEVRDCDSGAAIGTVSDIIDNTSQSLLEIERGNGDKVLIPYVDAFVKAVSLEDGVIEIAVIPGLIDED